ncbi:piggyBac transposable element-derived protein 4-like [Onthophagus taurus]|uniref:piggyBac transposable element-derived protein 4-like n=1 Tax=Onthophagus taurus TaxID=166361 RepID=UPI0039BE520C
MEKLDAKEFLRFVGLLVLAGVYKSHNKEITNLWNEEDGRPLFNETMSRNRFTTISQCLRFDNAQDRRIHGSLNKLAPIRALFELWLPTLQDAYIPYENLTVDEQLLTFRGRCPSKQYIPSKPGKYGIKIWAACDSKTSYAYNCQIYIGKTADQRERNQGKRVVLDPSKPLTMGLEGSGRNVTMDNFFISLDLAREMEKKLTLLGTIRKNKPELPQELVTPRHRELYSTIFGYQKKAMLAAYCPKKGKLVTLLSIMHDIGKISNDKKKKPQIILDYNKTKSGVDTMDKLLRTYTVKRQTRRWPVTIFYNMIDVSALNAYIIWIHQNDDWKAKKGYKRREFLKQLGKELVDIGASTDEASTSQGRTEDIRTSKRGRCYKCPRNLDR